MSAGTWDLLIIGAGSAGMAAAVTARRQGLSVLVTDESPDPGGHFYRSGGMPAALRQSLLGADYQAGAALIETFRACGADYRPQTTVWQVTSEAGGECRAMMTDGSGRTWGARAGALLLAVGAQERPFPVPGWTLPGVMGLGAAQTLMKLAGLAPAPEAVLVGGGPLLYLFAYQLVLAGRRVQALVETTPPGAILGAFPRLPKALLGAGQLLKGAWMLTSLRRAGIPRIRGASEIEVIGRDRAEGVSFRANGRVQTLTAPLILLHQGLIPSTNLGRSLGCTHVWDSGQSCWRPQVDVWGRSSVAGVWIAGDGAAIGGAQAAQHAGVLAALDIAEATGHIGSAERATLARPARWGSLRPRAVGALLDQLYRPPDWLRRPADGVVVCRCEEVTAGEVRQIALTSCTGPNQLKAFSRCGMGACQGRFCGPTVTELMAEVQGRSLEDVGYFRIRPPVKPITLAEMAAATDLETQVDRGDFPS